MKVPGLHLVVYALLSYGTYFAAGVILYLFRDRLSFHWSLLVLAWLLWMGLYKIPFTRPLLGESGLHWLWFIAIPYLLIYLCFRRGILNRFGKLGDLSYGLYIYGHPIQQFIVSYFQGQITPSQLMLYSFAAVLPLAWLSWHFIEKPALRWKNRGSKKPFPVSTP